MKTKIFLPVLAMLSLIVMTDTGSYIAHGVQFSDQDMEQLSRIESNFDELTHQEYAAAGIMRRSLGPDWWQEEIIWDFAFQPAQGNEEQFIQLRQELDEVMELYLEER